MSSLGFKTIAFSTWQVSLFGRYDKLAALKGHTNRGVTEPVENWNDLEISETEILEVFTQVADNEYRSSFLNSLKPSRRTRTAHARFLLPYSSSHHLPTR